MEQGYFQKLIAQQQASGAITSVQADTLTKIFSVMPEPQRTELEEMLTAEPKLIPLMIDNIGQKIQAINEGTVDAWKKVVADEIKKLDEL